MNTYFNKLALALARKVSRLKARRSALSSRRSFTLAGVLVVTLSLALAPLPPTGADNLARRSRPTQRSRQQRTPDQSRSDRMNKLKDKLLWADAASTKHNDTGRYADSQARLDHHRNQARHPHPPGQVNKEDVGDIAVIADNGSIVIPPRPAKPFDLTLTTNIDFTPVAGGYRVTSSNGPLDGNTGIDLPLGDDDTTEINLGFAFPFFGAGYQSMFVNSDGNVTFGAGDATHDERNAARLTNGPPRIAPLMVDLDATITDDSGQRVGSISVDVRSDRAVVTWAHVFQFGGGGQPETFQATMFANGLIRFTYAALDTIPADTQTVGIAPGNGQGALNSVDFSTALPATFVAGAIYQQFSVVYKGFDLANRGITFTPTAGGYQTAIGTAAFDPGVGSPLSLGDERSTEVPLGFAIPFLGQSYQSIFVNADGNVTFGRPDPQAGDQDEEFLGGPPRVAPLYDFLSPDQGGTVNADVRADRVVVSWLDVQSFYGPVTFQVTLHSNGVINFAYTATPIYFGIVGITGGTFARPVHQIDYTNDLLAPFIVGSLYERFGYFHDRLDLIGQSVTFTPVSGGFHIESSGGGLDSTIGEATPLASHSDPFPSSSISSIEQPLGFNFPFLGASYDRMFVNAAGNITFGEGDDSNTLSAAQLVGGPPRITPFGGSPLGVFPGSVHVDVRADRAVVTWWDLATSDPDYIFQAILFRDGRIRFVYSLVKSVGKAPFGVVGVAKGNNAEPINEIDFSANLPGTFTAGNIFEEFTEGVPFTRVDVIEAAHEFYRTHHDKYDFLVLFTDFPVDVEQENIVNGIPHVGVSIRVSNKTQGIGFLPYDFSSLYGSGGELEEFVVMNNINQYWPTAHDMLDPPLTTSGIRTRLLGFADGSPANPGSGPWSNTLNSPVSILAHEVSHRWLAQALFVHPTKGLGPETQFDLLGRQNQHWSFLLNTRVPHREFPGDPRSSIIEGNAINDLGPGPIPNPLFGEPICTEPGQHAFITDPHELIDGFTPLDQYLMGLRPASEVGSFWYVDDVFVPNAPPVFTEEEIRPFIPLPGLPLCGKRVDLTVQNIIAHPFMGPRIPAIGDEDDGHGHDVKTMAFILVVQGGSPRSHAAAINRLDTLRRVFEPYMNGPATEGRGRFDTSLDPRGH